MRDLIGRSWGYFTVIERLGSREGRRGIFWMCLCKCGNYRDFSTGHVNIEFQISCGCHPRRSRLLVGGGSSHPLYNAWRNIKNRCFNKNNPDYKYYGGKGLSICDEWRNSFINFYDWAMSVGWERGFAIDRINNDQGYLPSNCRFITKSENSKKANADNPGLNFGSSSHLSKLNEQKVSEIKIMLNVGIRLKEIALLYNVTLPTISCIKTNKTWKHVV